MHPRVPAAVGTLVIILLLALGVGPAYAQGKRGQAKDKKTRAAERYQRGVEHFQAERYAQALAEYQAAYELLPNPLLLFNIGLAHRAQGHREQAVAAFEQFLSEQSEAGDGAGDLREITIEAREYVLELKTQLAEERARQQAREREAAEAARRAQEAAAAAGERTDAAPARPGRGLKITGLVLASGGVALLATGAVFGARARAISDELENHSGNWLDEELARIAEGEAAERNTIFLSAAGGALLLAGGLTYWLGHRAAQRRTRAGAQPSSQGSGQVLKPIVAPAVLETGAARAYGLSMTGRF